MAEFPIVGIGSSAGGLEALRQLLRAMPPESGLAFIIAAHLDPTQKSHLTELLSRCTKMPVVQIENSIKVELDHVYVIAPDQELTIKEGVVRTNRPAAPRGHRHPVDSFFSVARRGSRRASDRNRSLRHRHQRIAGLAVHQGRRRDRNRARTGLGRFPGHAT
jgi:two-component system, chemotaxis family, CheB/CheR fusion protein